MEGPDRDLEHGHRDQRAEAFNSYVVFRRRADGFPIFEVEVPGLRGDFAPVELAPPDTATTGTPFSLARSSETTLLNPNWFSPARTAGTRSFTS